MSLAQIDSYIAGIPCIISVEEYDDEGCGWDILDRKGYKAPWLVKKMTSADEHRIFKEIDDYARECRYNQY